MSDTTIAQWALEVLEEENPDAIFFSGFDDAIIGVGSVQHQAPVVVYSMQGIIKNLVSGGMSEEDALDYFGFNVQGAYLGDHTPMIVRTPEE
jgi:hypothetical protein